MNTRLREIMRQSRLDLHGLGQDCEKWEAAVARFAEAIIQECLLSLEPDPMAPEIDYTVEEKFYQRSAEKIRQHWKS